MNVSSSKVSDLHQCSMLFYLKHVLMLPDNTHWKTLVGSALHNVIEYVLKPKRRAILDAILANGFSFAANPTLDRYCKMWRDHHKIELWDHQNVEEMIALTFTTLKPYLVEGQFKSEQRFEMDIGEGAIASGYIDILATGADKRILDMKTKGQKFTKKELPGNIQAAIYQMYYYEKYGELVPVDFIMTRFPPTKMTPKKHIQTVDKPTVAALEGLKHYLRYLYKVMNNFGVQEAHASFCTDTSFCDRVCPFRNPGSYWEITKSDGSVRRIWIDPKNPLDIELPALYNGETAQKLQSAGCPRYNPQ